MQKRWVFSGHAHEWSCKRANFKGLNERGRKASNVNDVPTDVECPKLAALRPASEHDDSFHDDSPFEGSIAAAAAPRHVYLISTDITAIAQPDRGQS